MKRMNRTVVFSSLHAGNVMLRVTCIILLYVSVPIAMKQDIEERGKRNIVCLSQEKDVMYDLSICLIKNSPNSSIS